MKEDWQDRIDAYFDGTASPEEVEALDRALLENEELRLQFLVTADLLAELPAVLGSEQEAEEPGPVRLLTPAPKPVHHTKPSEPLLTWRSFALAASVALAIGALFYALGPRAEDKPGRDTALLLPEEKEKEKDARKKEDHPSSLILVEGEAQFEGRVLSVGDCIDPPGRLVVKADATAVFRYPDRSSLNLEANAALLLKTGSSKRLFLGEGALVADMQPQPTGRDMIIDTANSKVTVIGTRYRLATTLSEDVLEVEHGKVRLLEKKTGKESIAETGSSFRIPGAADDFSGTLSWRAASKDGPSLPAKAYDVQRWWFTDDFKPEWLGGFWELSAHDSPLYIPLEDYTGDAAVLLQATGRKGSQTNVLQLSRPSGTATPVRMRLLKKVNSDFFFVQYDYRPIGDGSFDLNPMCLNLPAGIERETIYEQEGPEPLAAPDAWNFVKIEYLRLWDGKQWQVEVRRHLNGEHRTSIRLKMEHAPALMFQLKSGVCQLDNISVGDLYPVEE